MNCKQKLKEKIALGKLPKYIYQFKALTKTIETENGDKKRVYTHILDNLKNSTFYFSDPNNFNDPFDCVTYFSKPSLKRIFDKSEIDLAANANPNYQKDLSKNVSRVLKKKLGVSCFSAINDSILMWSHYADSHTGICLKFDISKDSNFFCDDLRFVNYRSHLPEIKLHHLDKGHDQNIDKMIFTKSLDWSYEQELRLLKQQSGPLKFKKTALKGIIFGCKCEERHSQICMETILSAGYENVKFIQAFPFASKYELEFKKVKEDRLYGYYFLR